MKFPKMSWAYWVYFGLVATFTLGAFQNKVTAHRRAATESALRVYFEKACGVSADCAELRRRAEGCFEGCFPRFGTGGRYTSSVPARFYPSAYLTCMNAGHPGTMTEAQLRQALGE